MCSCLFTCLYGNYIVAAFWKEYFVFPMWVHGMLPLVGFAEMFAKCLFANTQLNAALCMLSN